MESLGNSHKLCNTTLAKTLAQFDGGIQQPPILNIRTVVYAFKELCWNLVCDLIALFSFETITKWPFAFYHETQGCDMYDARGILAFKSSYQKATDLSRGFDSRSSHDVKTLSKSFTYCRLCASAWNSNAVSASLSGSGLSGAIKMVDYHYHYLSSYLLTIGYSNDST